MLGAAEGEYEVAAIRGSLIKLSPDTIINQEKRSVPHRKPTHATDWKMSDRFKNRFREPRDGKTGRYIAHETDAHDPEEDPNSEEEESCEEESDLAAAFERVMDELASVEEVEDTVGVQDVEDLRELSESMYEGLATIKRGIAATSFPCQPRRFQISDVWVQSESPSHIPLHTSISNEIRAK